MDPKTLQAVATIADPVERLRRLHQLSTTQQSYVGELARMRREAIAEAQESGLTQGQIAERLGVSPGRVSQMRKAPARPPVAPAASTEPRPRVLVQRALPTEPATRGSKSLYLTEAAQQGLAPERKMLYTGPEPASEHVAAALEVETGDEVLARRKSFTADGVPVRVATSYFRLDVSQGTPLEHPEFVLPTLQDAIEKLGHVFGHATETLTARPPTPFEADELDLDSGEWIVQVLRISYNTESTPFTCWRPFVRPAGHVFPIGQVAGSDHF